MLPLFSGTSSPTGTPATSESPDLRITPRPRQKRTQVARACDGCRIHRTKCDNNRPCSNCKDRGRQCSNNDATKVSTLSQAYDEIEHLRRKVQELEAQLKEEKESPHPDELDRNLPTPPNGSPHQTTQPTDVDSDDVEPKVKPWDGIQLRPARSPHEIWFGPSSLYHFVKRLSVFLSSSLQEFHSTDNMLLNSESSRTLLDGPAAEAGLTPHITPSTSIQPPNEAKYLTPMQEEYFINLFWQSYHTSAFAIIDEGEFKEHHQSLWIGSGNVRKPSALVDIVLAMCMQYGISTLPASQQGKIADNTDATIAGRWHYRRCQSLLAHEMESPTISTLQCHLLSALYLCGGSFHNMVDTSSGLAVRTAYMLGLHLDPPQSMSLREQEKRRRLWWSVYVMDSKINMKLGRPFLLHDSHAMPQLPSDNLDAAMLSGSSFAPLGDNATWLSFNLQNIKLFKVVRSAHTSFYDRHLGLSDGQTIWNHAQVLEQSAQCMLPHNKNLENWVNGVPSVLKTQHQNSGRPFSTDISALETEAFAPLWLQRQRLLLELMYHNLSISLYRPFIPLISNTVPGSMIEDNALRCAAHAMALTNIVRQVLDTTSILDGWHEVFHWQWGAAITLIGFILSFPQNPSTPAARSALDVSLVIFSIYSKSFSVANSAADIIRNLCARVDFLNMQSASRASLLPLQDVNFGDSFMNTSSVMTGNENIDWRFHDMSVPGGENLFDVALDVDFWGDMNTLWPVTDDFSGGLPLLQS